MIYYVDVTLAFTELVEADSMEEAEDLVRNMDWFEIPKDIEVVVSEVE